MPSAVYVLSATRVAAGQHWAVWRVANLQRKRRNCASGIGCFAVRLEKFRLPHCFESDTMFLMLCFYQRKREAVM